MRKHKLHAAVSLLALSVSADAMASEQDNSEETCLTQQKDTFLNPFSKESAHHRPIGSSAEYTGEDDPATTAIQKTGFGNVNSNNGWGVNVYLSQESDSEKTITYDAHDWLEGKGGDGLPVTLRVPNDADNGGKSDSVLVIVEGTTAHQFYQWRWNNGSPTAGRHMTWKTDELGYDPNGKDRLGTSASGVAGMFGLLRGYELNTPGCKINHVMQMAMSHNFKGCKVSQLGNDITWPAVSTDRYCKDSPELCDGPIPYGGLIALPRTVNLSDLQLSEPGARLAEALRDYGAYAVDGTDCTIFRADQHLNDDIRKKLNEDMQKIWTRLRMVKNNNKEDEVAGGGEPCAENTAYDSPEQQYNVEKCGSSKDTQPPDNKPPAEDNAPPDTNPPIDRTPPTDDTNPPEDINPPEQRVDPGSIPESGKQKTDIQEPEPDKPQDGNNDLTNSITEWLWENLSRTKEGMETFKKWILEFFA